MYNYGTGNNYSYGGYASGYGYGGYAPVAYPMPVYSTGSGCSNNFALLSFSEANFCLVKA